MSARHATTFGFLVTAIAVGAGCYPYPHSVLTDYRVGGTDLREVEKANANEKKSQFYYIEEIPDDGTRHLPLTGKDQAVDYRGGIRVVPNKDEITKRYLSWSDEERRVMHELAELTKANKAFLAASQSAIDSTTYNTLRENYDTFRRDLSSLQQAQVAAVDLPAPAAGTAATAIANPAHDLAKTGITYFNNKAREKKGTAASLTIQAYLTKGSAAPQQIHVENYDNIVGKGGGSKDLPLGLSADTSTAPAGPGAAAAAAGGAPPPSDEQSAKNNYDAVQAQLRPAAVALAGGGGGSTTDQSWSLSVDKAVSGVINLRETSADRGDQLDIIATVKPAAAPSNPAPGPGGAAPAPTPATTTDDEHGRITRHTFLIDRLDLSLKATGNIIFVNQIGSSGNKFSPAASAALSLHYRPRTNGDDKARDNFWKGWNVVDPAIGINVAALSLGSSTTTKKTTNTTGASTTSSTTSNNNLQVGFGVQLSFADDLLQVGYGYDLQADKKHQYWYFGVSVFDALNKLGKLNLKLP